MSQNKKAFREQSNSRYRHWTVAQWKKIAWCDESPYILRCQNRYNVNISSDFQPILIQVCICVVYITMWSASMHLVNASHSYTVLRMHLHGHFLYSNFLILLGVIECIRLEQKKIAHAKRYKSNTSRTHC